MDRADERTIRQSETPTDRATQVPGIGSWLAGAVERLVEELDPEQILLFGSHARNTATRRSDIDLCLVWDTDLPPLDRIGSILQLLKEAPRPVEAVAYTPSEWNELCVSSPFVRRIHAEGTVLYERGEALA